MSEMVNFEYFSRYGAREQYFGDISGTSGARALKLGQRAVLGASFRTRKTQGPGGGWVARAARRAVAVVWWCGGCRAYAREWAHVRRGRGGAAECVARNRTRIGLILSEIRRLQVGRTVAPLPTLYRSYIYYFWTTEGIVDFRVF